MQPVYLPCQESLQSSVSAAAPSRRPFSGIHIFSKRGESRWADMVFDPLGIGSCDSGWNTEAFEEGDDEIVAFPGLPGEHPALVGQENGAIGSGAHKPQFLKALHGADDRDMCDAEGSGDVHGAGFALGIDQSSDGFDIILRTLAGVGEACLALVGG